MPGCLGTRFVVGAAFVAVEAMVGGVDVHLDILVGAQLVDVRQRDVLVTLAEMRKDLALRRFASDPADAAAILDDGAGKTV